MSVGMDGGLKRMLQLAVRLGAGEAVTSEYIRRTFGVSKATAKRDLVRLECALPVDVEESPGQGPHPKKTLRLAPQGGFVRLLRAACA